MSKTFMLSCDLYPCIGFFSFFFLLIHVFILLPSDNKTLHLPSGHSLKHLSGN